MGQMAKKFTKFLAIGVQALSTTVATFVVTGMFVDLDNLQSYLGPTFSNFEKAETRHNLDNLNILGQTKEDILNTYGKYGQKALNIMSYTDQVNFPYVLQEAQINWTIDTVNNMNVVNRTREVVSYVHTSNEKIEHDNYAQPHGHTCKIVLSHVEDGQANIFDYYPEIKQYKAFFNDKQKLIFRQYIALHEKMHCEFEDIKKADRLDYPEYTAENIKTIHDASKPNPDKTNYSSMLSENFSDIGSIFLLNRMYGADDPDLKFVTEVIKTGRGEAYSVVPNGSILTHATYPALVEALTQKNIEKSINAIDHKEFSSHILALSHKGVEKAVQDKAKGVIGESEVRRYITQQIHDHYLGSGMTMVFHENIKTSLDQNQPLQKVIKDMISEIDRAETSVNQKLKSLIGQDKETASKTNFLYEIRYVTLVDKNIRGLFEQYIKDSQSQAPLLHKEDLLKNIRDARAKYSNQSLTSGLKI